MNSSRSSAILVGGLYITGTVAGVLSVVVTQPILGAADTLALVATHPNQMVAGALLVLTMGFALALVPVLLFPILKPHSEVLALGYLVFRGALETVLYLVIAINWLFFIIIGQGLAAAGTSAPGVWQALGAVSLKGGDAISNVLVIVFSLDACLLYCLLYRSKLIPRWISIWGLIAILLHFSTAFIRMFGLVEPGMSATVDIINLPIFLQEMVMAVWLMAKGFNPAALVPANQA